MRTLVIYDISEDRSRSKLREHLRNSGLRGIQYSGFIGEVSTHDRFVLSKEIGKYLSGDWDSIYVVPLCERCLRICKIISKNKRDMEDSDVEIVE
jgi:CRISPR-associated protein Cas2